VQVDSSKRYASRAVDRGEVWELLHPSVLGALPPPAGPDFSATMIPLLPPFSFSSMLDCMPKLMWLTRVFRSPELSVRPS
jgi:hypothetical protein